MLIAMKCKALRYKNALRVENEKGILNNKRVLQRITCGAHATHQVHRLTTYRSPEAVPLSGTTSQRLRF